MGGIWVGYGWDREGGLVLRATLPASGTGVERAGEEQQTEGWEEQTKFRLFGLCTVPTLPSFANRRFADLGIGEAGWWNQNL